MCRLGRSRAAILAALACGDPLSCREIMAETELSRNQTYNALHRCWRRGLVLRTRAPIHSRERVFKGRGGVSQHTRPFHLYLLRPEGLDDVVVDGRRYVGFSEEHLDPRGGGSISKDKRVLDFLRENGGRAFFSKDVAEALAGHGVEPRDVMANVRRFERQGLVYVRGYKTDEAETPFRRGYLLTWLDQGLPRKQAISEVVERTDFALDGVASSSPQMERMHRIRDIVLEHTELRKLVGVKYLENQLGCSHYELEHALERAMMLYPDMRVLKLFDAYRYCYHASMSEADLNAAVEMKRNYIRMAKGRANRIGHNWEAVAEWFIDRFTTGARFWTQEHRKGKMDPRRIAIHLLKGVGGRRRNAEVDRVWEVTPGIFAPPITYVLSCKWGLVNKRHVDDFLEVLRWSTDFGVDTPEGREIKQGIVSVFAASAFNTREHVRLKDKSSLSLAQYAARRNLQLVTAADFNKKLKEHGCPKVVTVQKVCRMARDEGQVRHALDMFWKEPYGAPEALIELRMGNEELYRFEKMLETQEKTS